MVTNDLSVHNVMNKLKEKSGVLSVFFLLPTKSCKSPTMCQLGLYYPLTPLPCPWHSAVAEGVKQVTKVGYFYKSLNYFKEQLLFLFFLFFLIKGYSDRRIHVSFVHNYITHIRCASCCL